MLSLQGRVKYETTTADVSAVRPRLGAEKRWASREVRPEGLRQSLLG